MKSYDFDNVEKDLSINPFRLQEECVSHPGIYFRYADACVEAKQEVSMAKDRLEAVIAERSIAIRKRCIDNNVKTTESLISSMVQIDEEVENARDKLREVEGIYARLNIAVQALDSKRSQLDNLVKLSVSNYYANNEIDSKGVSNDVDIHREIRKSMNRGKEND